MHARILSVAVFLAELSTVDGKTSVGATRTCSIRQTGLQGGHIYEGQITLPDLEFGEEAYAGGHRKSAC